MAMGPAPHRPPTKRRLHSGHSAGTAARRRSAPMTTSRVRWEPLARRQGPRCTRPVFRRGSLTVWGNTVLR